MTEADHLAAEHALGLLSGEELLAARGRMTSDPAFAAAVAAWDARLAPLLDEIAPVKAGPALWARIEAALDEPAGEVIALRRSVRLWRAVSAVAAAAAVIVALVALPRGPERQAAPIAQAPRPAPLLAALALPAGRPAVAVAYLPEARELVVAAQDHAPLAGHDDELWIIPAGGAPRSLGVIHAGRQRTPLTPELAALFAAGATVALTQERPGGSPTGGPQGPIIGKGALAQT